MSQQPQKKNPIFLIILGALIFSAAFFGIRGYLFSQSHETTDDAQVESGISPVISKISGYISEVHVKDHQFVKKGDTLLILDQRDLRMEVLKQEAALQTAQAHLRTIQSLSNASLQNTMPSKAAVSTVDAQMEAAKVNVWRASEDLKRYEILVRDHSITQQQFEQAQAAKQMADKQLQVLREQKDQAKAQNAAMIAQSAASGSQVEEAAAQVRQKQVDLENAQLNLSYTTIIAPESGMVSKINLHPGQYLQAGASLFSVVLNDAIWIVANFKETQLEKMNIGQKVTVKVSAFPDHEFNASLASFSPATGARFAILPPDNASGNFVKVVQRVPVKILFEDAKDPFIAKLRAGMNAEVDVHLK